jgi:ATP-dependent DNA ligase
MKLLDVGSDTDTIEQYITDPMWVMQQKHDGARMIALFNNDTLAFLNQSGENMSFAAAALVLPALRAHLEADIQALGLVELTLDGEIMPETGVYHVWDVLSARLPQQRADTDAEGVLVDGGEEWAWRDAILRGPLSALEGGLVKFAVTARTEDEKRLLWENVVGEGVEGAVSKHVNSRWLNGVDKPARTNQWVKHKLVKTADVVVTAVQRTFKPDGVTLSHGKAELAVPIAGPDDPTPWLNMKDKRISHDALNAIQDARQKSAEQLGWYYRPRFLLPVGNASLIGKELTIDVGSVVEVAYLNFQEAMIQPRILRQRFDKPAEECELSQFPEYFRTVVSL